MINKTATTTNLRNIRLSLPLGRWNFNPGLLPTLAVLLLLPALIALGIWQCHRASAKQQLLDQFSTRSQQTPQALANYEPVFTPVQVSGTYDYQHIILLDNRIVNHQPGYDVLVPFIPRMAAAEHLSGSGSLPPAVLVNLGWIAKMGFSQTVLTALEQAPPSQQTIIGLAQIPEHNLVLAHPQVKLSWPYLSEDLRLEELSRLLNRPLYPFILLLTGNEGFTHHWQVTAGITPARHIGYAVQWFGLALTLLVIYFSLNIHRVNA
jgi:surfeit locus 1 family protein